LPIDAARQNSGSYVNAIGNEAAKNNSGTSVNAFGIGAALNNSGSDVTAIGGGSASGNTGLNVIAIGGNSALNNTGVHINAFGTSAEANNIYNYVNLFGFNASATNHDQIVFTSQYGAQQTRIQQPLYDELYTLPNASGTLALSVNGNFADATGNITISTGGGTNPTSTFIPYNNAGTFADSYLINDTVGSVLKTNYSSVDKGLYLDFANNEYYLGDTNYFVKVDTSVPNTTISTLSGTGTEMVVADASGVLSRQTIPSGTVTGSGTATQVAFWDTSSSIAGNNDLWWDNTNNKLGIGTNTPIGKLDVRGRVHLGTGTPTGFINTGEHTVEITASGTNTPFTLIGGSTIIEVWTDTTPTKAISYGAAYPGLTPDGNIHFATYDNISNYWNDRILVDNATGNTTISTLSGTGTRMVVANATGTLSTQAIPTGGGGIPHATASGTDTYTATISGVTSYTDGDAYIIQFTNGNTTGATLNINGLGAVTLYRNNDGVLIGGDITSGGEMICVYDNTLPGFRVIGTSPNTLISYVTNADSVTITKGKVVYAFGGTGDRLTVKLANNTSEVTSAQTVGIVMSTSIATNQKGFIITQGLLDGLSILPTSTFADGDPLYLGATAGSITNVKPYAPNHLVYLGNVTTASCSCA